MRAALRLILLLALAVPAYAQPTPQWQSYRDPQYGYSIEVPYGLFSEDNGAGGQNKGLMLSAIEGGGRIQIYGGYNAQHADPATLARVLSGTDRVKQVTYRAGGSNWLVLSGYYGKAQGGVAGDVIFYTKFMFNPDHTILSAFEVSYPASEKRRYDALITHMEKSLTPPR
jgi:hypothetical protein